MRIDPWSYVLWAVLLLTVPTDWLLSAAAAALVHETAHLWMLYFLKGTLNGIDIHPGGAEIRTGPLDAWQELLCALAGPVASFTLVLLCGYVPKIAICGFFQGCFNLIPLHPLDGGRAVHCALQLLVPNVWKQAEAWISRVIFLTLLVAAAAVGYHFRMESLLTMVSMAFLLRLLVRKKPCKHAGFHVQ